MSLDAIEGRNPVVECLARARRRVIRVWIDVGARPDPRIARIEALAKAAGVPVERVLRQALDRTCEGRVHNGVVAWAEPLEATTTARLLADVPPGKDTFLVLADGLEYEHNLGAVLRSALGFGVDGLIVPTRRGAGLTPVVQRVAMGAAEVVPVIHEGMFAALRPIRDAGLRVVGADAAGRPANEVDLRGSLALILGAEGRGLSPKLAERCDDLVSIPMAGALESLNVSVAAAILMYEKRRQDALPR